MARRRVWHVLLVLLALFLIGTVIVLSTVSFYLRIDPDAYLDEAELTAMPDVNITRVPKILHQTWKFASLPEQWLPVSMGCRNLMPEYQYMLWTDISSRNFIADHYPWFLATFDAYLYPIQRADAIRYFILHHYGGIYLDLDIGCTKPLDPLLRFPVILPKTIPVGVSNDLMFAEPGHPFMEQTIHNLITFDHSWLLNYPTVMFSTGPMFLSAQYGLYAQSHGNEVRILPKSLYGKNAKPEEAPNAFFTHYYGSSWHADDAGFITFLGKWGKALMFVGLAILVAGTLRLAWNRRQKSHHHSNPYRRRLAMGRYDVLLPRLANRNGTFHLDFGSFSLSNSVTASSAGNTQPSSPSPSSPSSSMPASPILADSRMPLLPVISCDSDNLSPTSDSGHPIVSNFRPVRSTVARTVRNASAWIRSSFSSPNTRPRRMSNVTALGPSRRQTRTLFFLPAILTPSAATTVRAHERHGLDDSELPLLRGSSSGLRQLGTRDVKLPNANFVMQELNSVPLEEEDIGASTSPITPQVTGLRQNSEETTLPFLVRQTPPPPPLNLASSTPEARLNPHPPPYYSPALRAVSSHNRTQTPNSAWSNAWGEWGPEGEELPRFRSS